MKSYHVGILLFDHVDALDFAGPYEVFNLTTYEEGDVKKLFRNTLKAKPFLVNTVSHDGKQVIVHNGLKVTPDFSFANSPIFDVVIIPGGPLKAMEGVSQNQEIIEWIVSYKDKLVASVCTGAFFVAQAGLLNGKKATTNRVALRLLEKQYPAITVVQDARFVDEGTVVTSAGISAGIEMALHLVERLLNNETASRTAYTMEIKEADA